MPPNIIYRRVLPLVGASNTLRRRLVRDGTGSVILKVTSTFIALMLSIILARTLEPAGYGVYAFVFALVSILAIPAKLGLPQLIVRETAKAQAMGEWQTMRGLWRWSTAFVSAFSALLIGLAFIGLWLFGEGVPPDYRTTLVFGLLIVPFAALGNLRGAALRGLRKVVLGQLPETVLRPAIFILLIIAAILILPEGALDPGKAMVLHVLAAAIAFGIGAWMLWRSKPSELAANPGSNYCSLQWLAAAFPLALIGGLQLVNHHADILMLGMFRSAEEVGIYRVVVAGATVVAFGLQAVTMVVSPYFARLYSQGRKDDLQRLVTLSARAILALSLPSALVLMAFGDVILGALFGGDYAGGATALSILAVGQLASAVMGSVVTLLNMTGHEQDALRATAVAAAVNILLNMILIPFYGIEGAAFASAVTLIIWNVQLHVAVRRRLGIETLAFSITRPVNRS